LIAENAANGRFFSGANVGNDCAWLIVAWKWHVARKNTLPERKTVSPNAFLCLGSNHALKQLLAIFLEMSSFLARQPL